MTSSLVGSEMCIRDSPVRRSVVRRVGGGQGAVVVSRGATPGCCAGLCACLLYTSDAADDM
eukprot:157459-Prorocentrum_lima.AAC.1